MKINKISGLDKSPNTVSSQWPQCVVGLSAAFLAIGTGMLFGWPAPSIPKLLTNDLGFSVTVEETSIVALISPFGYLISCPLCAIIFDKVGRQKLLLFLGFPQITACLLIALSTNIYMIYASRFISGIAEGFLFSCLAVYLCEIAEPKIRGKLTSTVSVGMVLGYTLINAYGSYLPIRVTAYVSIIIPVIFISTFIWMPESPYFLLMKGDQEAARRSLQKLRRVENVNEELTTLNLDIQRQKSESGKFKDLFLIKSNLKAFFIVFGVRTFQQFSGISALGIYVQVIFQQANSGVSASESAIILGCLQTIVTGFGSYLVDKFGRKKMFISSCVATSFCLFTEALYFYFQSNNYDVSRVSWIPLAGMIMYTLVCSVGLGVVPNLLAGEIFSVNIKAKALCLMNIYLASCMCFTFRIFQYFERSYGMYMPFFFFGLCCLIGVLFSYYFVPETSGKTLEEIQQILKGNKKVKKIKSVC